MSLKRIIYAFMLVLVAGLSALSGVVAGGVAVYSALQGSAPAPRAVEQVDTDMEDTSFLEISSTEIQTSITQAVEKVGPAVVTVVSTIPGAVTIFGRTPNQSGSGSGVIISDNGFILTNNHVVEDAIDVAIILADGTRLPAELIGTDRYADLAVLKADGDMPAGAILGNSDLLKPGETVIAIGSPLGDFKNTVTTGVVSATQRDIDTGQGYSLEGLIQTDAAINQGNSGGPLVNLAGEVIAINTLIVRGNGFSGVVAEGLGFAIPVNTARAVAQQIIEKGYVSRPYLGIQWQSITPAIARRFDLPVEWGVYIVDIGDNSPADRSGLRRGDIITRIGETPLNDEHSYINALFSHSPGETIDLEVVRGVDRLQFQVTLAEQAGQ